MLPAHLVKYSLTNMGNIFAKGNLISKNIMHSSIAITSMALIISHANDTQKHQVSKK